MSIQYTIYLVLRSINQTKGQSDIIAYFKSLDYIDDEKYVVKYYQYYKENQSRRIIEEKLRQKEKLI